MTQTTSPAPRTFDLVTRGSGRATHIAHFLPNRTWCYAPIGHSFPLTSQTHPAGTGEPTCKTCRKKADLA